MSSAAAEREIDKWRIWGANKFLQVNASLSLRLGDGKSPSLDLMYYGDTQKTMQLLDEARSSLRDMNIRWAILGACHFLDNFPLRSSVGGNVLLGHSDVFRTFKKKNSGQRLYDEAEKAYFCFQKVRRLNKLSRLNFIDAYLPAELREHKSYSSKSGHENVVETESTSSLFEVSLATSRDLLEDAETSFEQTSKTLQTLLELVKHTSYQDYKASNQGWNSEHKLAEMKDEDMRYLLVRLKDGQPETEKQWSKDLHIDQSIIGFLSFMITQEEEENVVYIYEIHISEYYRDCGLGRHLFKMVEHVCKATGMEKTMLTVFKRNTRARTWYASRGYEIDEISPRPRKLRGGRSIEPDYEILSKQILYADVGSKRAKCESNTSYGKAWPE